MVGDRGGLLELITARCRIHPKKERGKVRERAMGNSRRDRERERNKRTHKKKKKKKWGGRDGGGGCTYGWEGMTSFRLIEDTPLTGWFS